MRIVLEDLLGYYTRRGYEIQTGLNPTHLGNARDVPFTWLTKDAKKHVGGGAGLSLQEIYLFELLGKAFHPERILIIGNGFGWSTLASCLIFPQATVVAIDKGSAYDEGLIGIALTRTICKEEGLTNGHVVDGSSPEDVSDVVQAYLGGRIDLALIDGEHTDRQQWLDYQAVKPFMSEHSAIFFHDVFNWGMLDSFRRIRADWSGATLWLPRTPSGMGVCFTEQAEATVGRVARLFTDPHLQLKLEMAAPASNST